MPTKKTTTTTMTSQQPASTSLVRPPSFVMWIHLRVSAVPAAAAAAATMIDATEPGRASRTSSTTRTVGGPPCDGDGDDGEASNIERRWWAASDSLETRVYTAPLGRSSHSTVRDAALPPALAAPRVPRPVSLRPAGRRSLFSVSRMRNSCAR